MVQIDIDESARAILKRWRDLLGEKAGGAKMDYSEAIRGIDVIVLKLNGGC